VPKTIVTGGATEPIEKPTPVALIFSTVKVIVEGAAAPIVKPTPVTLIFSTVNVIVDGATADFTKNAVDLILIA